MTTTSSGRGGINVGGSEWVVSDDHGGSKASRYGRVASNACGGRGRGGLIASRGSRTPRIQRWGGMIHRDDSWRQGKARNLGRGQRQDCCLEHYRNLNQSVFESLETLEQVR